MKIHARWKHRNFVTDEEILDDVCIFSFVTSNGNVYAICQIDNRITDIRIEELRIDA